MITNLTDYWNQVNQSGTPEAKLLLTTEALFALTEAKAIARISGHGEEDTAFIAKLQERILCLLICHRGPVLANWLMERASGKPIPVDGPGPVVPDWKTTSP